MIVYVSIGNSDDKLTQAEWSSFVARVANEVGAYATVVHGAWYSLPNARWQNACWCLGFDSALAVEDIREALTEARKEYRQDSVAWAVAETEFI